MHIFKNLPHLKIQVAKKQNKMQITGKCKLQKMIPSFGHESEKMG